MDRGRLAVQQLTVELLGLGNAHIADHLHRPRRRVRRRVGGLGHRQRGRAVGADRRGGGRASVRRGHPRRRGRQRRTHQQHGHKRARQRLLLVAGHGPAAVSLHRLGPEPDPQQAGQRRPYAPFDRPPFGHPAVAALYLHQPRGPLCGRLSQRRRGLLTDHAVGVQPRRPLKAQHGSLGPRAEQPIHRSRPPAQPAQAALQGPHPGLLMHGHIARAANKRLRLVVRRRGLLRRGGCAGHAERDKRGQQGHQSHRAGEARDISTALFSPYRAVWPGA